jgi:hypothetical protein
MYSVKKINASRSQHTAFGRSNAMIADSTPIDVWISVHVSYLLCLTM